MGSALSSPKKNNSGTSDAVPSVTTAASPAPSPSSFMNSMRSMPSMNAQPSMNTRPIVGGKRSKKSRGRKKSKGKKTKGRRN